MLAAWRRVWPSGWRPDLRTVGLLLFGFFAVQAIGLALSLGNILPVVLGLPPPGSEYLHASVPYQYPLDVRILEGAALAGGLADGLVALGGLGLMASARRAPSITAGALVAASLAIVVEAIAQPRIFVLPERVIEIVWLLVLFCVVTGRRPHLPRSERESSSPEARSWMEDAFEE